MKDRGAMDMLWVEKGRHEVFKANRYFLGSCRVGLIFYFLWNLFVGISFESFWNLFGINARKHENIAS